MASVIAGGLLFNVVAFTDTGFLLSKLNHRGYEGEIKRHKKSKQLQYEMQSKDANQDIDKTNKALDELKCVQTIQ